MLVVAVVAGQLVDDVHIYVILQIAADPGQVVHDTERPAPSTRLPGPMPDSSRSFGEPIAPAVTTTSQSARRGAVAGCARA